jgi:hypothetical protein
MNGGLQTELKVTSDLPECVPDVRTVVEDGAVFRLVEIEKIRRSKHMGY